MTYLDKIKDTVQKEKACFKFTPQRVAIINFLENNTSHPSAEMIYKEIKRSSPGISFSTVYNTLEKLVELGFVSELNVKTKKKHFDPDTSDHNHIVCTCCDEIFDIFEPVKDLPVEDEILNNFRIKSYEINLYGICPKCIGIEN